MDEAVSGAVYEIQDFMEQQVSCGPGGRRRGRAHKLAWVLHWPFSNCMHPLAPPRPAQRIDNFNTATKGFQNAVSVERWWLQAVMARNTRLTHPSAPIPLQMKEVCTKLR